jgi:hypothetical protein
MNTRPLRNALIATLLGATQAFAASVMVYTDRAAWEAAVSTPPVYEGFDTPIPQSDSITFACCVASEGLVPNATSLNYVDAGSWHGLTRPTGNLLLPGYESIIWTFPHPVTAVAGDWSSIGLNHELTITATFDGITDTSFTVRDELGASGGFLGIVGTGAFTTVTLWQPAAAPLNEGFEIDNLRFTAVVPEPETTTLLIALTLLAGIGMKTRRRRSDQAANPAHSIGSPRLPFGRS